MKLIKNKLLEFRCMIYAIIISYVFLDSCIGCVTQVMYGRGQASVGMPTLRLIVLRE